MSQLKTCPVCAEEIQKAALKCRYCNTPLIPELWQTIVTKWRELDEPERTAYVDGLPSEQQEKLRIIDGLLPMVNQPRSETAAAPASVAAPTSKGDHETSPKQESPTEVPATEQWRPVSDKVSKAFFMCCVTIGSGTAWALSVWAYINNGGLSYLPPGRWLLLYLLSSTFSGVVLLVLLHKAWVFIQDGNARTTPGKAVGYLFIPVFNFYWVFQAYLGFSKDFNDLIKRHVIKVELLPDWPFLFYSIISVTASILIFWDPGLFLISGTLGYFVTLAMVDSICDGLNSISEASRCRSSRR